RARARTRGAVHVGRDGSTARRRVSRGREQPQSLSVRVGISLLTLVPRISGGSETYARELVRALGRVGAGAHEYRVFVPRIADDVDGLPSEVVDEYRASRSLPGRMLAMAEGVARGGPLPRPPR